MHKEWENRLTQTHSINSKLRRTVPFELTILLNNSLYCKVQYRDGVDNTVDENSSAFCLIRMANVLVAVSNDMRAANFCTNKTLQFLSGGAGLCRLTCIMVVVVVVE